MAPITNIAAASRVPRSNHVALGQQHYAPQETKAYAEQVEHALMAGDTESAEGHARGFQDLVAARITQLLEAPTTRSAAV